MGTNYRSLNRISGKPRELKWMVICVNLPTILSGPILRRVEPTQIYIWIALSKRYKVSAELFSIEVDHKSDSHKYHQVSSHSETQTIKLGKQLYINLIKITPSTDLLPTQTLLGYNLLFRRGSELLDLDDFQLLSPDNPHSIVYGKLKYPTFFNNSQNNGQKTNIIYGSCRKLHGKGKDALASGDLQLQKTYLDIKDRPSSLFMVGDQIYADDVADPIAPYIYELGNQLIGREEELSKVDERLAEKPFDTSMNQVQGRRYIAEHFCHFTSTHASNHLMKLGEYSAMYLMSWSPELWGVLLNEKQINTFENETKNGNIYFVHPDDELYAEERNKEYIQYRDKYNEQVEDLHQFHQTLPQVRRLLANIPTYMIFDDHDITDDWNISSEWKHKVSNSPLGKHIVANGLTAYWAFQGWGNEPDSFDSSFLNTIWKYVKALKISSSAYQTWNETIWNFDSWHFVTPTEPSGLFLDTRTQRSYPTTPIPIKVGKIFKERTQGPNLISHEGWGKVSTSLYKSGWKEHSPLIIVSAAPLYGIELFESFLLQYVFPLERFNIPVKTRFDLETWKFSGEGFNEFHQWIAKWNPGDCIILSGDAHMAFSVQADVTFSNEHEGRTLYQFTSSPLNNMSFYGLGGFALRSLLWLYGRIHKNEFLNRYCDSAFLLHENHQPSHYLWKEKIQYHTLPNESFIDTDNNLGLFQFNSKTSHHALLKLDGKQQHKLFKEFN